MRSEKLLLFIDAIINLGLGLALIFFPQTLVSALGVPFSESAFYPSILGAILFGIGLALLVERNRGKGLGLEGAVIINLCGGVVLASWLIFGELELPLRGQFFLWGLVALLICISSIEVLAPRCGRSTG